MFKKKKTQQYNWFSKIWRDWRLQDKKKLLIIIELNFKIYQMWKKKKQTHIQKKSGTKCNANRRATCNLKKATNWPDIDSDIISNAFLKPNIT